MDIEKVLWMHIYGMNMNTSELWWPSCHVFCVFDWFVPVPISEVF